MRPFPLPHRLTLAATLAAPAIARAQAAPISHLRYEVTVDSSRVASRTLGVVTTFTVDAPGTILLALPGWTPGAYEMSWFARWVHDLTVTDPDGHPLVWDKADYQTWRIQPGNAKAVRIAFTYEADTLDNAMSWTGHDLALFNGTNIFMYPIGRGLAFASTVAVHAAPGWGIATGMTPGALPATYTATNYHDLVDMPFVVGRFDIDSVRASDLPEPSGLRGVGRWVRLVTYPTGTVTGSRRTTALDWLAKVIPPESAVFHETPWSSYTVLQIADSVYGGFSGLEHQNSHVDIVAALGLDDPFMPSLYAHEIFHSWNVKRLRPADMVPYRYDSPEPTPWLWVSEGITDYYADLAEVRGGVTTDSGFYAQTSTKIADVAAAPPTALTDASVSTWIHPTDGTQYVYYSKGSLAGLMLDLIIRDASNNARSLDHVMRDLYESTYKKGRGFTAADWWTAVSRAAGGKSFDAFHRHYIDGRDPFPWDSILPLAGLRMMTDSVRELRLGIFSALDTSAAGGVRVIRLEPGGAAAAGGVHEGDILVSVGDIPVTDVTFGTKLRARYSNAAPGTTLPMTLRRDGQTLTVQVPTRFVTRLTQRVSIDPAAPAKAVTVRDGILHGRTTTTP